MAFSVSSSSSQSFKTTEVCVPSLNPTVVLIFPVAISFVLPTNVISSFESVLQTCLSVLFLGTIYTSMPKASLI